MSSSRARKCIRCVFDPDQKNLVFFDVGQIQFVCCSSRMYVDTLCVVFVIVLGCACGCRMLDWDCGSGRSLGACL